MDIFLFHCILQIFLLNELDKIIIKSAIGFTTVVYNSIFIFWHDVAHFY